MENASDNVKSDNVTVKDKKRVSFSEKPAEELVFEKTGFFSGRVKSKSVPNKKPKKKNIDIYTETNVNNNPKLGIAEGSVFGRKKIFIIHDGLEEAELDTLCMESYGRNTLKLLRTQGTHP